MCMNIFKHTQDVKPKGLAVVFVGIKGILNTQNIEKKETT